MTTKSVELDYSALANLKPDYLRKLLPFIPVPIFAAFLLILFGIEYVDRIMPVLFVVAIVLQFIIRALLQRQTKQLSYAVQAFAKANKFSYVPEEPNPGSMRGTIFKSGESRKSVNIVAGTYSNLPFRAYEYQYIHNSGRTKKLVDFQVFEMTLPRVLPHMVIDSLVEHGNGRRSTLPIAFDTSQKIMLEGDFHKYFALYAPDKYGITALSVIAPDAMEALMKYAAVCDIEIIDNRIYFYWPDVAVSKEQFEEMFRSVGGVMAEIQKKLESGDIYAHKSQAEIHTQTATHGQRLAHRQLSMAGFIALCILTIGGYVALSFATPFIGETVSYIMFGLLVLLILWGLFARHRRRRLRNDLMRRRYDN